MKNLVYIDLVHLDQDFGESDTRWFIPNKLKHIIIWGKVSWCDTIPGRKIITLKLNSVHVIFSKTIGSRDRLPALA